MFKMIELPQETRLKYEVEPFFNAVSGQRRVHLAEVKTKAAFEVIGPFSTTLGWVYQSETSNQWKAIDRTGVHSESGNNTRHHAAGWLVKRAKA